VGYGDIVLVQPFVRALSNVEAIVGLYLPEITYIIIFLWLISSGPGRLSVDHWIAVRFGFLDCRPQV